MPNKQYHCYRYAGNTIDRVMPDTGYEWKALYDELFTPSEKLTRAYRELNVAENTYVVIHARFCNALEQFENTFMDNHLDTEEQKQALIERCHKGIMQIKEEHPNKEIYVLLN
jgi:DNA primase